jgi:hypothetical protein
MQKLFFMKGKMTVGALCLLESFCGALETDSWNTHRKTPFVVVKSGNFGLNYLHNVSKFLFFCINFNTFKCWIKDNIVFRQCLVWILLMNWAALLRLSLWCVIPKRWVCYVIVESLWAFQIFLSRYNGIESRIKQLFQPLAMPIIVFYRVTQLINF